MLHCTASQCDCSRLLLSCVLFSVPLSVLSRGDDYILMCLGLSVRRVEGQFVVLPGPSSWCGLAICCWGPHPRDMCGAARLRGVRDSPLLPLLYPWMWPRGFAGCLVRWVSPSRRSRGALTRRCPAKGLTVREFGESHSRCTRWGPACPPPLPACAVSGKVRRGSLGSRPPKFMSWEWIPSG